MRFLEPVVSALELPNEGQWFSAGSGGRKHYHSGGIISTLHLGFEYMVFGLPEIAEFWGLSGPGGPK